jgi:hypothetical protein
MATGLTGAHRTQENALKRRHMALRYDALRLERQTWVDHWRDLAENIRPRGFRFLQSERNKGTKQNDAIINGTPIRSCRTLAAGMMTSVTSPSRRWFQLGLRDRELEQLGAAKLWLAKVADTLADAIAKANIYKAFHLVYLDLCTFGTSCFIIEADQEDGMRAYVLPVGSYCLANDARMAVDTLYRTVSLTVAQLVEKFGAERCSLHVQTAHKDGQLDLPVEVVHVIEPNRDYLPGRLGPAGKKWRSCWYEAASAELDGFLAEAGYAEKPFVAVRWETTGEDVYGRSPGMDALGDCKQLQESEREKGKAIDKLVTPPMQGPAELANQLIGLLPGDFTAVPGNGPNQRLSPAAVVEPAALVAINSEIRTIEERVKGLFYADLWLLLSESDKTMTAREVSAKREEKMQQLGAVLENLQDEMLDPAFDIFFWLLEESGKLPPPPEEIAGHPLKVEYTSMAAAAQKLLGTTAIERLVSFVGSIAAVKGDILDVVNFDQVAKLYADALGVPPGSMNTDDVVTQLREARAKAAQAQQQSEQAQVAAQTAKTLGETPTEGPTALNTMLQGMGVA